MAERTGVITMFGKPLTLLGEAVMVGQKAPDFTALDHDMRRRGLGEYAGKVLVVVAVPSLDTPVCDKEARRFNAEAAELGSEVAVLVVSMDLPFAQKRWCEAAGVGPEITILSDHREALFGMNWGVLIKELRLLARAVFVVDKGGTVKYMQIVPEATKEPDYEAALQAARGLL